MHQHYETKVGSVILQEPFYYLNIKEGAEILEEDARELIELGTRITHGLKVAALVDATASFTIDQAARDYFAKQTAPEQFICVAVITNSLPQRLLVNFYIKFSKPNTPTKLFGTVEDARKWCESFL